MHAQALIMYLQPSSEATLHRSAGNVAAHTKALRVFHRQKELFPPGLEPGTFRVLGERDNHYTTETQLATLPLACDFCGGAGFK